MRTIAILLLVSLGGCATKSATGVPDLFTQYKTPQIFQQNQPQPSLLDKLTGGGSDPNTPGSISVSSGVSSPGATK